MRQHTAKRTKFLHGLRHETAKQISRQDVNQFILRREQSR
jgi:hypothetical protein